MFSKTDKKGKAKIDGSKEERQLAQEGSQGGPPRGAHIELEPKEQMAVCKADRGQREF